MSKLAGISGREAVKKFQRVGYSIVHQRGSHVRLRYPESEMHKPLTVLLHQELKIGLLCSLIKDAGLNVEDFLEL